MIILLLAVTFALALGLSATTAWLFKKPFEMVLHRFVNEEMSTSWSNYLRFAVIVVGVSVGTRVRILEQYLAAPSWNKAAIQAALTQEFWALELYRTIVQTLQGIAWLLLLLSVLSFIAFLITRGRTQSKQPQTSEKKPQLLPSNKRVAKFH